MAKVKFGSLLVDQLFKIDGKVYFAICRKGQYEPFICIPVDNVKFLHLDDEVETLTGEEVDRIYGMV